MSREGRTGQGGFGGSVVSQVKGRQSTNHQKAPENLHPEKMLTLVIPTLHSFWVTKFRPTIPLPLLLSLFLSLSNHYHQPSPSPSPSSSASPFPNHFLLNFLFQMNEEVLPQPPIDEAQEASSSPFSSRLLRSAICTFSAAHASSWTLSSSFFRASSFF